MNVRLTTKEQEKLVLEHKDLVKYLARKWKDRFTNIPDSELDDLVSEGSIGLINAATSFDTSKGVKFKTYATVCIEHAIIAYIRKEKRHRSEYSLDNYIDSSDEDNKTTFKEVSSEEAKDFIEEIEKKEDFEDFMNVVLNRLEPRERLIILYRLGGKEQKYIAKILKYTQSYICKLEKRIWEKIKQIFLYARKNIHQEAFFMTMDDGIYRISFSSKKVKEFNKIFAAFIQNINPDTSLPDFEIRCSGKQIVIRLPAQPDAFSFIAHLIQEIDEFDIRFKSRQTNEQHK